MNIKILCIGKLKEKYWKDAAIEYSKRMSRYAKLTIQELKESRSDDVAEEGNSILSKIKLDEYVITLEIEGEEMSSPKLARTIEALALRGKSNLCFIIGGSEGLSEAVIKRSDLSLSFSKMTFPHQMMRVILLEQIYRSFKIIRGEEYHK